MIVNLGNNEGPVSKLVTYMEEEFRTAIVELGKKPNTAHIAAKYANSSNILQAGSDLEEELADFLRKGVGVKHWSYDSVPGKTGSSVMVFDDTADGRKCCAQVGTSYLDCLVKVCTRDEITVKV